MLILRHPIGFDSEYQWVSGVVLAEILGLEIPIRCHPWAENRVCIELYGLTLDMPAVFMGLSGQMSVVRSTQLKPWLHHDVAESPTPILFGSGECHVERDAAYLGIDIFGTAFYMLSRFEEVMSPKRDNHERFPGSASLAYEAGFLDRPIVDEYVEILWRVMAALWPGLKRAHRTGTVVVTCDVDNPFDCSTRSVTSLLRAMSADILKRRSPGDACCRLRNAVFSWLGDYRYDPYNTFANYLSACDRVGRRAAFYFIAARLSPFDGCYELHDPMVSAIIKLVHQRGHELGVHGSYNAFRDQLQVAHERTELLSACGKISPDISLRGHRQHFLRWDASYSPDCLDAAGYAYDSTGGFADLPGFRYGTAHSFTMWSWQKRQRLRLKQRPLVAMECSVVSQRYLGLGYTEGAMSIMNKLKRRSLATGGDFVLLWHNTSLVTAEEKEFFNEIIS